MAELLLRTGLGILLITAASGKFIGGVGGFVAGVAPGFMDTIIPLVLIKTFLYSMAFAEIILGLLLISGLWRKITLTLTGVFFLIIIAGLMLKGDAAVPNVFLYLFITAYLLTLQKK